MGAFTAVPPPIAALLCFKAKAGAVRNYDTLPLPQVNMLKVAYAHGRVGERLAFGLDIKAPWQYVPDESCQLKTL